MGQINLSLIAIKLICTIKNRNFLVIGFDFTFLYNRSFDKTKEIIHICRNQYINRYVFKYRYIFLNMVLQNRRKAKDLLQNLIADIIIDYDMPKIENGI